MNTHVSTIIPAYNSAATLPAVIDSALAQDFEGQEIIVVNDGSTDSTATILASYGDRIIAIHQSNQAQPTARNVAIERARGQYLAFRDADDIWLPGRLSKTVGALERNSHGGTGFLRLRSDRSGRRSRPALDRAFISRARAFDG